MFADHGIRGLLVTTAVIGAPKIARAVDLAARAPDTIFIVETEQNVRELSEAAARVQASTLNLAVDLYFGRTGVSPGAPARGPGALHHEAARRALRRDPGLRRRRGAHQRRSTRGARAPAAA